MVAENRLIHIYNLQEYSIPNYSHKNRSRPLMKSVETEKEKKKAILEILYPIISKNIRLFQKHLKTLYVIEYYFIVSFSTVPSLIPWSFTNKSKFTKSLTQRMHLFLFF